MHLVLLERGNQMRLFYYFIPIIINIVFAVIYFSLDYIANKYNLIYSNTWRFALFTSLINVIVIPVYLVFLFMNYKFASYWRRIINFVCSYMIILFGLLVGYLCWGITTGNTLSPDSVTVLICRYELIVSTIIFVFGCIILRIVKYIIEKSKKIK